MMPSSDDTKLDFTKIIPLNAMRGDDEEDTLLLREMAEEAANYLCNQKWCHEVTDAYFGLGVGGVVAVFLFKFVAAQEGIGNYVWIVAGDLPPLYIAADSAPNPACALDGYIGAMECWASAAVSGESTAGLPPVAADATPENGTQLLKRLDFIDKNILSQYQDDLNA